MGKTIRKKQVVKGLNKTKAVKSYNMDRKFEVWLGHVNVKEEEANVRALLVDISNEQKIEISNIARLHLTHAKFQSYKFSVPYAERYKILNPEIWPEDLTISHFTAPNPNNLHNRPNMQVKRNSGNRVSNSETQNDSYNEDNIDDDRN
jgi:hypothetical protein